MGVHGGSESDRNKQPNNSCGGVSSSFCAADLISIYWAEHSRLLSLSPYFNLQDTSSVIIAPIDISHLLFTIIILPSSILYSNIKKFFFSPTNIISKEVLILIIKCSDAPIWYKYQSSAEEYKQISL